MYQAVSVVYGSVVCNEFGCSPLQKFKRLYIHQEVQVPYRGAVEETGTDERCVKRTLC